MFSHSDSGANRQDGVVHRARRPDAPGYIDLALAEFIVDFQNHQTVAADVAVGVGFRLWKRITFFHEGRVTIRVKGSRR